MHDSDCGCDFRPVELVLPVHPRCPSCGVLVELPATLPAEPGTPVGATNLASFYCLCGAGEIQIRFRLTA